MTEENTSFISIPQNPIPAGGELIFFTASDGARLRGAYFPAKNPRGNVVLLSGRCEFIEKYFEVIEDLLARGLNVATMDWRGQGLSARMLPDPIKGHIDNFDVFTDDLRLFVETQALPRFSAGPNVIMTHSMGGLPALRFLSDGNTIFSRAVLCAPMTGFALPAHMRLFARAASFAVSALGGGGASIAGVKEDSLAFEGNALTSDPKRHERFRMLQAAKPEACIMAPTYGWMRAALEGIDDIHQAGLLNALKTPVLIISAELERLVSTPDHKQLAETYDLIDNVVIEGALHEIMMERDEFRSEYWAHFDRFTAPLFGDQV